MPANENNISLIYDSFPDPVREKLLYIKGLIYDEARQIDKIEAIGESLKWGQPSYHTIPKAGSPIRLGHDRKTSYCGLYVHCQTGLIEMFKRIYPEKFIYSGKRAILFGVEENLDEDALRHCIAMALTYHLHGKAS